MTLLCYIQYTKNGVHGLLTLLTNGGVNPQIPILEFSFRNGISGLPVAVVVGPEPRLGVIHLITRQFRLLRLTPQCDGRIA